MRKFVGSGVVDVRLRAAVEAKPQEEEEGSEEVEEDSHHLRRMMNRK